MSVKRDGSMSINLMGSAPKRCKTAGDALPTSDMKHYDQYAHLNTKNTKLNGRKRFNADLRDMVDACAQGIKMYNLNLTRIASGDDEGNVEFVVAQGTTQLISVTLMVSDTSEYPNDHTFYAFSSSKKPDSAVLKLVETIAEYENPTLYQAVARFLRSVAVELKLVEDDSHATDDTAEPTDEGSDEDDAYYDSDNEVYGHAKKQTASTLRLNIVQEDFIEIVACNPMYRPGFIRFGDDSFAISVSTPIVKIPVPAQALQAWDRSLMSSTQHFTLLISGMQDIYPILSRDGTFTAEATRKGVALKFHVGLSPSTKPSKSQAQTAIRSFRLLDEERIDSPEPEIEDEWSMEAVAPVIEEPSEPGSFKRFALSHSLEVLLEQQFLSVLRLRLQFKIGWAGAELMHHHIQKVQVAPDTAFTHLQREITTADQEERQLAQTYDLPLDPILELEQRENMNLPAIAFAYTVRRFMLCSRYCSVCHDKVNLEYEVLKPYVCKENLCQYQYYDLNMGSSLELDLLSRGDVADILISAAYCAAGEGVLNPSPVGLGLRVPLPDREIQAHAARAYVPVVPGGPMDMQVLAVPAAPAVMLDMNNDGLCDFDLLTVPKQCAAIKALLDQVPAIPEIRNKLEKKRRAGNAKIKVAQLYPAVEPAAWTLVRWILNSCTAHLEPCNDEDELIQPVDASYKQYRFSMGAPDAEAKFSAATEEAKLANRDAVSYPMIYAFHGSPLRNWHSIIRNGLWFKEVTHGRAYGHGVYFAMQGETSMSSYASGSRVMWPNSTCMPTACTAVATIVNQPDKFVSSNPYLVVAQTDWIVCRYLLVRSSALSSVTRSDETKNTVPYVQLDPKYAPTLSGKPISIPEPTHKLSYLLAIRQSEVESLIDDHDEDDRSVFELGIGPPEVAAGSRDAPMEISSDEDNNESADESWFMDDENGAGPSRARGSKPAAKGGLQERPKDDWKSDAEWVRRTAEHLIAPPVEASPMAIKSIQRELKSMLDEQSKARSLTELGWYLPAAFTEDQENLFQWIVELHSFDPELPIAKDLKAKNLNSIIFEIRFPPSFPHSPPFFRIVKPRFLPFIQGGGGHVTGGGSICMDLLTADGWLPSYSISAVLLQIKLAISNPDPRPARLAQNWDIPYTPSEALAGYQRAAATHNWKVPNELDKMIGRY